MVSLSVYSPLWIIWYLFNYLVLRISMHSTIRFRVHVIVPLAVTGSGLLVAIDTSFQVPDSHMIMYHAARGTDL